MLNPDSNVSQMIDQIDDIFFSIAYGIVFSQIIMSFCDIFESEFMRFNISVILSYFFALILLIEWFREWAIWVRRERPSGEFPFLKVCLYYLPALLWIEAMVHYVTYVPLFALITLGYWLINLDYDIINYYYYLRRRLHFDAYRLRNMKIWICANLVIFVSGYYLISSVDSNLEKILIAILLFIMDWFILVPMFDKLSSPPKQTDVEDAEKVTENYLIH